MELISIFIAEFLPILGQNLNPESDPDVWTKAVIAVGEISIKLGNFTDYRIDY
jgi:hypothetical protein